MCKYWLQFGSVHAFVFLSDLLLEELCMLASGLFLPLYVLYLLKLLKGEEKKNNPQINMFAAGELLAHSACLPC